MINMTWLVFYQKYISAKGSSRKNMVYAKIRIKKETKNIVDSLLSNNRSFD